MGNGVNKMADTTTANAAGQGYSCTFVETPPHDLRCIMCMRPAHDPQQTACCGRLFCRYCLTERKKESSECPQCHDLISCFYDRASDARIKRFVVRCSNEVNDCQWVGKLRELEEHLQTCQCGSVLCSNGCGKAMLESKLDGHLATDCPLREHKCVYCEEVGPFREMTEVHLEMCPNKPVTCPNADCGRVLLRQELPSHRSICLHEMVTCTFMSIGCHFAARRGEQDQAMVIHQREATARHLELAMSALLVVQTPPRVFKMAAFEENKTPSEPWYSPPFYSHRGGYRMCLAVAPSGTDEGKGTHLAVSIVLMKGLHDEELTWPFRGEVVVELLNQQRDRKHHTGKIVFQQQWVTEYNGRVIWGEYSTKPWGNDTFVPLEKLTLEGDHHCQYLKDDCIYFRVVGVKTDETNKSWLMQTD